jgi:hypothetical protein
MCRKAQWCASFLFSFATTGLGTIVQQGISPQQFELMKPPQRH